jgi:hypothetical protein
LIAPRKLLSKNCKARLWKSAKAHPYNGQVRFPPNETGGGSLPMLGGKTALQQPPPKNSAGIFIPAVCFF